MTGGGCGGGVPSRPPKGGLGERCKLPQWSLSLFVVGKTEH